MRFARRSITGEPLFRRRQTVVTFCRMFGEAHGHFDFELRGFRLDEEWLSFYIKPADGLQLPAIMQWVKQTFAVRFNLSEDRTRHVWGDRYWSRVLEGEPPEGVEEVDWAVVAVGAETGESSFGTQSPDGVSPLTAENPAENRFSPQTPARSPPTPGPKPRRSINAITLCKTVNGRSQERSVQSSTPTAFQRANADALLTSISGRISGGSMLRIALRHYIAKSPRGQA
jgi:hypothetical protein